MAKTFQFRTRQEGYTTWVEMPDVPSAILERVIDTVFPGFVDELDRGARDILKSARERWPRETGRSAEGLDFAIVFDADRGKISGRLFQGNPDANKYWHFIKSYQNRLRGRQAIQVLVRTPMKDLRAVLIKRYPQVFKRRIRRKPLKFSGVIRG